MAIQDASIARDYYQGSHRRRTASRWRVRRDVLAKLVLTVAFYAALWRATSMWYGLPANFDDGAAVDPLPMKLMLYSLIPLSGLYFLLEQRQFLRTFSRISPLIGIVAISCLTSIVFSIDRGASLKGLAAVIVLAVPPLLFRARYGNVEAFRILGRFAIAAAFINVLYTVAFPQFAIMRGSYAGMVKGAFYHKNTLGQFCSVSFVCLLSTQKQGRLRYSTLIRWAAMLCLLALIVATKSSTAVVLTMFGSVMLYAIRIIHVYPNRLFRSFVVALLFVLVGFAASFIYLGVASAVAEAFGKDLTFSGRTNIWEQLLPLIWDKPITGYGFAMFRQPEVMEEYVKVTFDARSTHNTYLELALNIGIPGIAAWVLFLVTRLFKKMTIVESDREGSGVRRKEIVIIILIMLGSMTEAGMMLAPFILWPHTVIALSELRPRLLANRRPREA
ncbi:O-antigen ligase family protein [Rhizobium leguminosarum]|uniref:O-antigen ligase family protein n=1 Tax=Rhizobium leguminosarum TaxID=384 RepID=UPI001030B94C|nr:O-antigen ligase family protein [Rhizobium leguminosarum]TAV72264.1 O-antigen ligase family protein [Rhizobium leguminosarum]TAV76867.1 O-antigen ligase family protein [Rhizobium leguminosarum]TAZ28613.1 O-antigen ligase family protein [Rhizobium leguminosarum]